MGSSTALSDSTLSDLEGQSYGLSNSDGRYFVKELIYTLLLNFNKEPYVGYMDKEPYVAYVDKEPYPMPP